LLQTRPKKRLFPVLLFFFFFFIFLATSGGHTDPVDGFVAFLFTENFVMNGTPALNVNSPTALDFDFDVERIIRFKTGDIAAHEYDNNPDPNLTREEYIKRAIENASREEHYGPWYLVLPTVAVPLYVTAQFFNSYPYTFVSLFLNSIIIGISCVVVFFLGKSIFGSEKIGFVLALIFGVTSFIWPYNSSMFARPLAILFLMLAIYLIYNNKNNKSTITPFLSAVFIGLFVLSHTLFLLYVPGFLIFGIFSFKDDKRKLIAFLVGVVIIAAIIGSINYARFDSITSFGFGSTQEGKFLIGPTEGLYAFLLSPGKSIFLYFPIALLFPLGIYFFYKKNKPLAILIIYLILVTYLYLGFASNWNLSNTWGPHRYLLPLIPLIVIPIGSLLIEPSKKLRWAIISLSVIGFIFSMIASLVWFRFTMSFSRAMAQQAGLIEHYNEVRTWDPSYSPPLVNFAILATDYVGKVTASAETRGVGGFFQMVISGCSFDVFIFCKFGIIPIILLGILIAILGFFILNYLGIVGNKKSIRTKNLS